MNISALSATSQINSDGLDGAEARADYHVAIAQKINQQVKQEGEAITKLIESTPVSDGVRGVNLNTRA